MARGDLRATIKLLGDSTGATRAIKSTEKAAKSLGNFVSKRLVFTFGELARVAQQAFAQIEKSAAAIGQKGAFVQALEAQGVAADAYLEKLTEISDGQIAANELILASNRALGLGIKATDLPGLLELATQASVNFGISVEEAFSRVALGVGKSSSQILDEVGIVLDAAAAYESYGDAIGKSATELTKAERIQANVQNVLRGTNTELDKFFDRQSDATRAINQSKAALENFTTASGQVLAGLVQMTVGGVVAATTGLSLLAEAGIKAARGLTFLVRLIPGLNSRLSGFAKALENADDGIDSIQQRLAKLSFELAKGGAATVEFALGMDEAAKSAGKFAPLLERTAKEIAQTGDEADETVPALDSLADSLDAAGTSTTKLGTSLQSVDQNLINTRALVITLSTEFDALAAKSGSAVAIQAALAGGSTLSSDGRRINFPRGGSRLTSDPLGSSPLFSGLGGGVFSNTRRVQTYVIGPDGRVNVT